MDSFPNSSMQPIQNKPSTPKKSKIASGIVASIVALGVVGGGVAFANFKDHDQQANPESPTGTTTVSTANPHSSAMENTQGSTGESSSKPNSSTTTENTKRNSAKKTSTRDTGSKKSKSSKRSDSRRKSKTSKTDRKRNLTKSDKSNKSNKINKNSKHSTRKTPNRSPSAHSRFPDRKDKSPKAALKAAQQYVDVVGSFSERTLLEQLKYEDFPKNSIDYAMKNVKVDWNKQALKTAKILKKNSPKWDKNKLSRALDVMGFTESQTKYAIKNL